MHLQPLPLGCCTELSGPSWLAPVQQPISHESNSIMMSWLNYSFHILVAAALATCTAATTTVMVEAVPGHLQQRLCSSEGVDLSDTTLMLSPGEHSLEGSSSCLVVNAWNLAIVGVGDVRIRCTDKLVGMNLIFANVTNLTISDISMEGCGRVLPPDIPSYVNNTLFFFDELQKIAFLFAQVTNLNMYEVHLTRSFGFGIIGLNLRGDTELLGVTISDTDNYRHQLCHRNDTTLRCSGAGAQFVYSDLSVQDREDFPPSNTSLIIRNCSFINNTNIVPTSRFLPVFLSFRGAFTVDSLLLTGATGLGIYFGQRSYIVDVSITSSTISNNRGYASGLAFLLFNTIRDVHIDVTDCILQGNEGTDLARGGGMLVLVIVYISELGSFPDYPDDIHDLLVVRDTTIAENFAEIGGGGYSFLAPQNISDFSITFDNVTFESNRALIGTAFEADTRPATFSKKNVHFLLSDVTASNNRLPFQMVSMATENSAAFVLLDIFNVTVVGQNHTHGSSFVNNSPGPFLVVGGHLYLQGKVDFINNTALRGGALSLFDYSLLFIHEGSRISFINNVAGQVGGAIHASSPGSGTAPTCVFQVIGPNKVFSIREVSQLDLSLIFVGNRATDGGNSIYVSPLYGCASLPESSLVDISVVFNSSILYEALFKFESPVSNGLSEISSIPERVCLCSDNSVLHPEVICSMDNFSMTVVPGEHISLRLYPVDRLLNPATSIVLVSLNTSTHSLARGQASYQLLGGKCTMVDLNIYGPESSNVSIALHTQQGTSTFLVHVTVDDCPPGYLLTTSSSSQVADCSCDPYVEEIGSSCNFTTYTISRRSNSWLGTIEHVNASNVVYVFTCPTGFCNSDIRFVDLTVQDQLCQPGRTGIMCGACISNLSAVFGSQRCMECSNFWLFTIFVYAAAGIALVALLFLLNLTISQGSLNIISLIFYANLISVNSSVLFPSTRGFLFIWISLLNLELGFPLCFYDGMTEAAKAGLQCIFPLYLLSISLGLILLGRQSRRVAKLLSSHGIQVLATILYLSFSKMLRYVIDILSFATLFSEEQNHVLWLFDGNIEYFTGAHIVIVFIPASATLIFILLYIFSLVFIKQVERYTSRLKPFLDAYGGAFKDNFRFWFGIRLLVLSAMYLTYAVVGTDDPVLSAVIQQVFLVLLMVLQAFLRPFRLQIVNAVDLFYMLNLFFLLLHTVKVTDVATGHKIVQALVSVGFILFLLLIVYRVYCIPIIRSRCEPWVEKLKQVSWSDVKNTLCKRCRKVEEKPVAVNEFRLGSIDATDVRTLGVSTTEITLEGSVNADKVLKKAPTFSRWRDSSIEAFDSL